MFSKIADWFRDFHYNFSMDEKYRHKAIAGITLLVVGLILACSPLINRWLIASYQPQVSRAAIAKNNRKKGEFNYRSVKRLSLANIAQARAQAKNIDIIGEIVIPADHIYLPISKGISNLNLALTAGTFRPDMKMGHGNYALAGHNMANHSKILFSPLYDYAKPGQKIYITDLNHVYTYRMYERKIIDPSRVDVVQNTNRKIVTLVTCDETGAHRLMVRGNLIKSQKLKHAPHKVQKLFNHKYNNK